MELDGLRFSYRTGDEVLRGIDLRIPAGASVAVVGETGSGKTTIAKLLCRLADPTAGAVRIGGVDLRDGRPGLAAGGDPDGAPGRVPVRHHPAGERLRRAGRRDRRRGPPAFATLGLGAWLDDLPGGLDAPVGERGTNLSVGERQLVALARAQLGDPGLLVLDEATSSVDPETEQALTSALERLAAGRTVVSIAHRLSTAERADLVVVVDAGEIVEQGSHDDLVAAGGIYAGLYASWLGNTRGAYDEA